MSTLADRQLAAWQAIAEQVATNEAAVVILRCEQPMTTGQPCGKSIAVLTDNWERRYSYTPQDILAQTVLHLRNHHPDLDPDR